MLFSGLGFGYIFELQIFLKRFIDIYSVKNIVSNTSSNPKQYKLIREGEIARFDNLSAYYKEPTKNVSNNMQRTSGNIPTTE